MAQTSTRRTKYLLNEEDMPRSGYTIAADLPVPQAPGLNPGTGEPIGPGDLAPLFPMELIKQVVSQGRYIEIPDEVREVYALYRPSPLFRAHRLENKSDVERTQRPGGLVISRRLRTEFAQQNNADKIARGKNGHSADHEDDSEFEEFAGFL